MHRFGRPHDLAEYRKMFAEHTKPGDTVVLLVTLAASERVPTEFEDLLPRPWAELEAQLHQGQTIALHGEARGVKTLLLAAPTALELEKLAREQEW